MTVSTVFDLFLTDPVEFELLICHDRLYVAANTAMKRVFDEASVDSCKVTHQRTTAIQYAGFEGLAPYQINTMTNDMLEKQHSAYQSVMERQVSST